MKKNYDKIHEEIENIREQKKEELKKSIKKFKKKDGFNIKYFVVFDKYAEMYTDDRINGIINVKKIKGNDFNRINYSVISSNLGYKEWCPILEIENNIKIIDDDGYRHVKRDNKLNTKLTKQEALDYFYMCTVKFK